MTRKSPLDRFLIRIDVREDSDCIFWTGLMSRFGYGRFNVNRKDVPAHRFIYEHCEGPIPEGMYIDHICRVKNCVNPHHLRVVTPRQNSIENSNGTAFDNHAKTHCVHGHELSEENLYRYGTGRMCKTCANERWKDNKEAHNAAVRKWRNKNRDRYNAYHREYDKKKRMEKQCEN